MKEPKIEDQIKEAKRKLREKIITEGQYKELMARIARNYREWLDRDK